MSELCGYLVPDKAFEIGQFKKQVNIILYKLGIINGFYDIAEETLAAGQHSFLIFSENLNNSTIAFEYAKIHDSENRRLIPEEFTSGANCCKCGGNIDDSFFKALSILYEQEYDGGSETDMALFETTCDSCGYINKLGQITFDHDVKIKNQYLQFVNIEADFNIDMIEEIGQKLGCNFKVFYDSF